ncbi:MAG: ABC transporter substrate-binding protein [Acetobacteraceae bacterium]|nr:ABC transporter substrate-binding protein [Acetobacteraceae bacterium]
MLNRIDPLEVQTASAKRPRRCPWRWVAFLALLLSSPAIDAKAEDQINFGIDWRAEAEYGGYYQALAKGFYAKHGLKVTIREGGPQVNHMQLLMAGRLDFNLGGGRAVEFVQQNLPYVAIAAIFQKDPAVLIAHPGQGNDSFAALKGKPIEIAADARQSWWRFLAAKYGYTDAQTKLYTFNMAPFLADKALVQQGYLGSEPFLIKEKGGFDPVVLLVADGGFRGYSNIITTGRKIVTERPGLVQRFIDASLEGWYSYLYDDPGPANRAIKLANPEMSDALLAYGRRVLKEHGIVDSGDALTSGIGAMTPARWAEYYNGMVGVGVYPAGLDIDRAFLTTFVNKRVGIELKK